MKRLFLPLLLIGICTCARAQFTPPGGPGGGDMLSTNNLSDVANVVTARTNLGLAIGTNVQAYDPNLDTFATITLSDNAKALINSADFAAMRTLLSLVPGTDVEAHGAGLDVINANTGSLDLSGVTLTLGAFASGTAAVLPIADAGNHYTTDNVEAALQQVGAVLGKTGHHVIGCTIDGAGSAISTGKAKGYITVPYGGTITGYSISADTGTCTVTTWKVASGTAVPTVANSISTSGVSLSTGTHVRSTTVTDFTSTTVTAGDIFAFNVSAVSGATQITFELEITE